MPTSHGFSTLSTTSPPTGRAGVVLANGSLSSQSGGEGEIRRKLVEADLVDCIVAMPPQLFYTTQIPVSIWFFNKDKKQKGKTLFIDARNLGTMVTRKLRELTDSEEPNDRGDIQCIADTYRAYAEGRMEAEKGFCAAATTEEIAAQDFVLDAGPLCRHRRAGGGFGAFRREDGAADGRIVGAVPAISRFGGGDPPAVGAYRV